ncbi:mitochondrial glutamate carrier 1-like isoform X2 [Rhynchophorus ferrugineus]
MDAFKKIYIAEGIRGMYRGSGILILLVTPEKAIKLSANDFFRFHLKDQNNKLSPMRQALAGAFAGIIQLVITTPMELLKIQLQDAGRVAAMEARIDPKTGKSLIPQISARQVTQKLVKERGVAGLYKGLIATMARDVPFCMIYFPLFAKIDSLGPRKSDGSGDAAFYWSFLCGLIAGSFTALVVTPCDVMKTRIQTVTKSAKGDKSYATITAAFRDILETEGTRAFFKGGACRMIVIAPLYAIIQTVYFLGVAEKMLGIKKDIKHVK